uniref:Mos1 transposase HTH domain-containing protein n=1 Tax=Glossina morsitans morsitans TaxID=37546 RepID=A0A1B0G2J3_GLOMM
MNGNGQLCLNDRAVIFHGFRLGPPREGCIHQLTSNEALPFAIVQRWYNELNRGRRSLRRKPGSTDGVQKLITQD